MFLRPHNSLPNRLSIAKPFAPSRERNVSAQYIIRNSGLTAVIVTGSREHEKSSALRVREILSSEGILGSLKRAETHVMLGVRVVMQRLPHLAS